ncbi:MAG: pilus assembly protein [Dehalococcoidia bacterium]|nr:pilus assembly protein [Dehalococcoidia bacterium]
MELTIQGDAAPRRGPIRRLLHRFRQTEAGQSLVEFTMILPIFLVLMFGLIDFGRAFYTWLLVTNAAREGARVAAVQADSATVQDRIYDSFCSNYPSDCSLDPAKLDIDPDNIQGLRGTAVSINLAYDFEFVTPLGSMLKLIGGSDLAAPTITAHSSMRLE